MMAREYSSKNYHALITHISQIELTWWNDDREGTLIIIDDLEPIEFTLQDTQQLVDFLAEHGVVPKGYVKEKKRD